MKARLLYEIVSTNAEENVGVSFGREGESVVECNAALPAVFVPFQFLGVERMVMRVFKQKPQSLIHPALKTIGQALVVLSKLLRGLNLHARAGDRFLRPVLNASTVVNGPRRRPAWTSASAARSPFCQASVHQYIWSGSMRQALPAPRASSSVRPLAWLRSCWIRSIFALARASIRCSAGVRRGAGALAASCLGGRTMRPPSAVASRKSPTSRARVLDTPL